MVVRHATGPNENATGSPWRSARRGAVAVPAGPRYAEPDFLTRLGRLPTAFLAASLTPLAAFLAASERLPAGLLSLVFLPTTFLAASPTARADFFAASDS